MATIFYLHGFGSVGNSAKSQAIRSAFPKDTVISPDLPVNPNEIIKIVTKLVKESISRPVVFIGTSLGGFWANFFAQRFDAPCVLINPATNPAVTLAVGVGKVAVNYKTKAEFTITSDDIEQYATCKTETDARTNGNLINLFLAEDDDVIDYKQTLDSIPYFKSRVITKTGGHRYDNEWPVVIGKLSEMLKKYTRASNKFLDLEKSYEDWFCFEDYGSFGGSRAMYITESRPEPFVRAAYMEGANKMAADILDTLKDYACACAGLEQESMSPSEMYDRVHASLENYIKTVQASVNGN